MESVQIVLAGGHGMVVTIEYSKIHNTLHVFSKDSSGNKLSEKTIEREELIDWIKENEVH